MFEFRGSLSKLMKSEPKNFILSIASPLWGFGMDTCTEEDVFLKITKKPPRTYTWNIGSKYI